jgi:hypothetical protein
MLDQTTDKMLYRIYTENFANLPELVARYFGGATIYDGLGLWQGGQQEQSAVIEIIGHENDLQSVTFLAADIKQVNSQQSVIVTWARVSTLTL